MEEERGELGNTRTADERIAATERVVKRLLKRLVVGYSSCKQLGRFPVQCNCREPLPSSLDKLVRFVGQHRFHCGLLDSSTEGPMEGGVGEGEGKSVGGGGGSGSDASESRGGSRNGLYVS
ncbi:hypothetical protein V1477_016357 [Vespula maculifrons]|uniref:Uncharacterized protein n=2 Tax=Vespula TaxID=7451 RepID=A0A834N6W5_VESVU|nr:hypothetical protein HZH66_006972 [Vespula vulgaris]